MWRTLRARGVPEETETNLKYKYLILFAIILIEKRGGIKIVWLGCREITAELGCQKNFNFRNGRLKKRTKKDAVQKK